MIGHLVHIDAKLTQHIDINSGFAAALITMRRAHTSPHPLKPISLVWAIACACLKLFIQMLDTVINDLLRASFVKHAFTYQLLGIDITCRGMLSDRLIHKRLGKRWLIPFIMAKPAIAEHINNNVRIESLPKFNRDPRGMHNRFGIVTINVKNRCHNHFGNISRIWR